MKNNRHFFIGFLSEWFGGENFHFFCIKTHACEVDSRFDIIILGIGLTIGYG